MSKYVHRSRTEIPFRRCTFSAILLQCIVVVAGRILRPSRERYYVGRCGARWCPIQATDSRRYRRCCRRWRPNHAKRRPERPKAAGRASGVERRVDRCQVRLNGVDSVQGCLIVYSAADLPFFYQQEHTWYPRMRVWSDHISSMLVGLKAQWSGEKDWSTSLTARVGNAFNCTVEPRHT